MALREKLRIVVCGYIGLFPAGGAVWDYAQYVLGFAALGHDVFYIEDTGNWPSFVPEGEEADGQYNVRYLARAMASLGLEDRWAYRDPVSDSWFGMDEREVSEILSSADMFLSISCSAVLRDEWREIPVRVVVDSDPMFTQVQLERNKGFTKDAGGLREKLDAFSHHFTFGENIGEVDCKVPVAGYEWIATRQPIALDHWQAGPVQAEHPFTTVMNWSAVPPLDFGGKQWGQKDSEFEKILDSPEQMPERRFAVVMNGQDKPGFPHERFRRPGWLLLDPAVSVPDAMRYRRFILNSAGELSVAKHAYVAARTGWFSCRTACYLAASRPAVVQETGWSKTIPQGDGLQAFSNREEAIEKARMIAADLPRHARGARAIAEEYFDARMVLEQMIERCRVIA